MEICEETLKQISCAFFRWWYNAPGNNTEQGFDEWWKENKGRYVEIDVDEARISAEAHNKKFPMGDPDHE